MGRDVKHDPHVAPLHDKSKMITFVIVGSYIGYFDRLLRFASGSAHICKIILF